MTPANKGIFNIPTGGGKTRVMSNLANQFSQGKHSFLVVVATPRIQLTSQISREFFFNESPFRDAELWTHQCYHSGTDVKLDLLSDTDRAYINSSLTTIAPVLTHLAQGKNAIVFTTYHSLGKLIDAFAYSDVIPDILFCDEAHNLVSPEWNKYCDPNGFVTNHVKNMLFFTATNKVTKEDCCGMDDLAWFGPIIHRADPRDLIDRGIILAPLLITAEISVDMHKVDDVGKYSDLDAMSIVEETISAFTKEHSHGATHKIIVTCDSADQAGFCANTPSATLEGLAYTRFLVLSDVNKRKGHLPPSAELDAFKAHKGNAIIFQYDIISEGIDVPGITAILLLRGVNDIKVIQTTGRTLRFDPIDRDSFKAGLIKPGDFSPLWRKPYGAILVPLNKNDLDSKVRYKGVGRLVQALREHGFNFNVGELVCLKEPKSKNDLIDIDTIDPKKEAELKEAIDSITVEAEELWAIYVGYKMPQLAVIISEMFE